MPPKPIVGLTTKQLEVFNYITVFMHEHQGMAPTLREIARDMGFTGHSLAFRFINILIDKGYLAKQRNSPQSIEIIKYPNGAISPTTGAVRGSGCDVEIARAAYARGVREGRRLQATETDREKAARNYDRGYAAGKKEWPADLVQAFERGIAFGKQELRRELTESEKRA